MATTRRRAPSRKTAPRRTKTPTPPVPVAGPGERVWLLDAPWGEPLPGAKWVKGWKANTYIGPALPPPLAAYRTRPFTYLRWVEDAINGTPSPHREAAAPKTPRPHQVAGATAIAARAASGGRGVLLTDAPGNGKTITTALAAKAIARMRGGRRVLVLADRPAAITIEHWASTITGIGDGGLDWLVVTLDHLPRLIARNGRPRWRFDVIICDEAHNYRHQSTKRVAAFWKVAQYHDEHQAAPFVMLTTATPGHSVAEETYLAPILAQLHDEPTAAWEHFGKRLSNLGFHVAGSGTSWGWDDTAKADMRVQQADADRLHRWLATTDPPSLIHRPAEQGPVPLDALPVRLDYSQRLAYETEWGQFSRDMDLARRGRNVARGRAALLRFRQKAGLVRVPQTIEWVLAQVDAGLQVVVSCEFVETAADPLAAGLREAGVNVAHLYGVGRFEPEVERLRFQRGHAQVVVTTKTASISLHASEHLRDGTLASDTPRVGVFHQVRYSGIAGQQITGRTHRDRQVSPWSILYGQGTVEREVARVMVERIAAASASAAGAAAASTDAALGRVAAMLGAEWLPATALTGQDDE